jgi:hypothetical protein
MLGVQIPCSAITHSGDGYRTLEKSMAIRKNIAAALLMAAHAVAKDQSKERIQKWVRDTRVKVAKAIEPN